MESLNCQRCGKSFPPENEMYVCEDCGGKLIISYDHKKVSQKLSREKLEGRERGVWKYRELLPVSSKKFMISMGEGNTPLLRAERPGKSLGVNDLWLKDETQNPTLSFKDRSMCVGISKALEFGAGTVVTASSGNAAAALAAYSAKAGIECFAFVPEEASETKLAQIGIHGANLVKVSPKGAQDPSYKLMQLAFENFGWRPIPSSGAFNPYQPEGCKTISFEICEQMDWKAPDWNLVSVGAGTLLSGCAKGFSEFKKLGFVDEVPKIGGVQAEGCAPLVKGFVEEIDPYEIPTWEKPNTIARGLIDPYPWDADSAIPAIRKSGGTATSVPDQDILSAMKLLARTEGIFAEPSGAAGLAGLIKLMEDGKIERSERVVVTVTGAGLKDQKTSISMIGNIPTIEPRLERLEQLLSLQK